MDEPPNLANQDVSNKQSSENFQKFVFELFEKNGVINDLRAYLRGHIVNILRTSDSGEALVCQKNYTQRLELSFQAINILIAEYLLRLEFSYSLSVFVSEIPLANMVFSFARMLMETNDHSELRFKDSDVFSILKYIGIKYDTEHANLILDMYKDNEKTPLLLCILRCLPLYDKKENEKEIVVSSSQDDSISSKSSEEEFNQFQEKCRHHAVCKTCRDRVAHLKQKYKRKKKSSVSNICDTSNKSLNVDMFLKNISSMEKGLIDELFQQLKSVYEAEMEMIKQEEEKRVQRSLAVHLLKLKQKRDQLESSYKAREEELQVALQEKKRFLWGLARTLREQHQHMTKAMAEVKAETERLATKEDSLRLQLLEAEKIFRRRGIEMRKQISSELSILENHLETMKRERDSIDEERQQLQKLKLPLSESDDLKSHYELLREELNILNRYFQSDKIEPKCMIDSSTMTEQSGVVDKFEGVLNNGKEIDLKNDKPKRLVNDLKKLNNVHFDPISIEDEPHERSPGRSSTSSEAGDAPDVETSQYFTLRAENRRLREFARQQREHIDFLSWQQARLQAQLSSQLTSLTPLMTIATGPRPVTSQNTTLTTQNTTLTSGNIIVTTENATFAPRNTANTGFTPENTQENATFTPENVTITPGNTTFNPQIGPLASQAMNVAAQNSSFGLQTSIIHNRNIPNPFIFQSPPLPRSMLPESPSIGTQLLPPRPQPVGNRTAVVTRPRTTPLYDRNRSLDQRLHPTASVNNVSVGWRIGAGEELSLFSSPRPRVVVPGDEVPFVGVIGGRQRDNRRYLINQWRSLRRRISPHGGILKRSASPCTADKNSNTKQGTSKETKESPNVQPSCSKNDTDHVQSTSHENGPKEAPSKRDKSPKTLLKESKDKLKNNNETKQPSTNRVKNPNSVLREAKLRLKKLEIEAEAVEKSYLDFRKKRDEMKEDFKDIKLKKIDVKQNKSIDKYEIDTRDLPITNNFDKQVSEINAKLDLSKYKNKITTANKTYPIPKEYSEKENKRDYLETPLTEFRKYYNSGKRYEKDLKLFEKNPKSFHIEMIETAKPLKSPLSKRNDSPKMSPIRSINSPKSPKSPKGTRKNIIREVKNDKKKELEILKQNIGKIYNMSEQSIVEISESNNEVDNKTIPYEILSEDKISTEIEHIKSNMLEENYSQETVPDINLLRVEVENTAGVNLDFKAKDYPLVIVESSVNEANTDSPIPKDSISLSTQMTIVISPKRSPMKNNNGVSQANIVEISEDLLQPVQNFNDSRDHSQDLLHQIEDADYFDDFSADVDNYNSHRSEFGNEMESPISLATASEEDNFWDM